MPPRPSVIGFSTASFSVLAELLAELLRLREERVEQARRLVLDLLHLALLKLQELHDAVLVRVIDLALQLALGLQAFDLEPVEFGIPLAAFFGRAAGQLLGLDGLLAHSREWLEYAASAPPQCATARP